MADRLWAHVDYIIEDARGRWSSGEEPEHETSAETLGELYRDARSMFGRCIGRIYVDAPEGPRAVGWAFVKRERYDRGEGTYLQEAWVTALTGPTTVIKERHYA